MKEDDRKVKVALLSIIIGVVVLFASSYIVSVFRVIIGLWIVATGVMDLQTTLVWKEVKSPYWTTAVILSILRYF